MALGCRAGDSVTLVAAQGQGGGHLSFGGPRKAEFQTPGLSALA